jgi:hypothetical protein
MKESVCISWTGEEKTKKHLIFVTLDTSVVFLRNVLVSYSREKSDAEGNIYL